MGHNKYLNLGILTLQNIEDAVSFSGAREKD
jgi:hypothetical protein